MADAVLQPERPRSARRPARLPAIDTRRCTGCGRCVGACDLHLLSLEPLRWQKFATLHAAHRCTGCSLCALRCPFDAITMLAPSHPPSPTCTPSACSSSPEASARAR